MQQRRNRKRGFTLIELMVVVTILGILASLTSVAVMKHLRTARIDTTKTNMRTIMDAIRLYQMRKSKLPERLEELVGDQGDLETDTVPKDAWGGEFVYERQNNRNYTLRSLGADGVDGGEDEDADINKEDITNPKQEEK